MGLLDIIRPSKTKRDTPAPEANAEPEILNIVQALEAGHVFSAGEEGEHDGAIYASRFDGNVWTPRQHPAVWVLISNR